MKILSSTCTISNMEADFAHMCCNQENQRERDTQGMNFLDFSEHLSVCNKFKLILSLTSISSRIVTYIAPVFLCICGEFENRRSVQLAIGSNHQSLHFPTLHLDYAL